MDQHYPFTSSLSIKLPRIISCFLLFFIQTLSLKPFQVQQETAGEVQQFSTHSPASPELNSLQQSGTCHYCDLTLTQHRQSTVCRKIHFHVRHNMRVDTCARTYTSHYAITQSHATAMTIPCDLPLQSSTYRSLNLLLPALSLWLCFRLCVVLLVSYSACLSVHFSFSCQVACRSKYFLNFP